MSDVAGTLREAWEKHLLAGRWETSQPRDYVYASRRRPCVRCMALDLLHPEDEDPPGPDALERMTRGKEREEAIIGRLLRIGVRHQPAFTVTEGQRRFEVRDRDGTLLIVGKVDGVLHFEDGRQVIFECKSGRSFEGISSLDDFSGSVWTRHAIDQLLVYLLAMGQEEGLFILDGPGMPRFIPVRLEEHLDRAESFLKEARQAVDARFGRAPLPDYPQDRSWCEHCPHLGKTCLPPTIGKPDNPEVIQDSELEALLERRHRLHESAKEFARIDRKVKARLRDVCNAVCGRFRIHGKWSKRTVYDIPKEIKEQYARVLEKGTFSLKIEPLAGAASQEDTP